jgi:hypothetical protein
VAGGLITDELLEWPPDLSALANILERAEAFRFAFAPVGEWPPARIPDWARAVDESGASGLGIPVLPRLSATRLSQRRFWRGRVPDAAGGEVTLRPSHDLVKGR